MGRSKKSSSDIYKSLVQLILTIGNARTSDKFLPPFMIGNFDGGKITFVPYNQIQDFFYLNDFNWNVSPSNYNTKEFKLIYEKVWFIIDKNTLLFYFILGDSEFIKFIKDNSYKGKFGISKTQIDKNNFWVIYDKWLKTVKLIIILNKEIVKKSRIIYGDFYLADLLSIENSSLKDKLFVLLQQDHYTLDRKINEMGMFSSLSTEFSNNREAHQQFWSKYERPPKEEYWDYIVERGDLLVSQDIRERKGCFFTPRVCVELSQKHLANELGKDWQDEYYIWDCAAVTGNLLESLTNKYNVWGSTLDLKDVSVIQERINTLNKNSATGYSANLLKVHVFLFDFPNDDFTKLPLSFQEIINNPQKNSKLVEYINPPYAEVFNAFRKGKKGVNKTVVFEKYSKYLKPEKRELYTQFLIRIFREVSRCRLAEFSKIKIFQGATFENFRSVFNFELKRAFLVKGKSFDNVKGSFLIGFIIWDLSAMNTKEEFIFNYNTNNSSAKGLKKVILKLKKQLKNNWISKYYNTDNLQIGFLACTNGSDFQHINIVYLLNDKLQIPNPRGIWISPFNIIFVSIYFSVRHCIPATWLNDKEQFLNPNDDWKNDIKFQNDIMIFTLLLGQNRISSKVGIIHWIPFSEEDVFLKEKFESNYMSLFIKGKIALKNKTDLFAVCEPRVLDETPLQFFVYAKKVLKVGLELSHCYHHKPKCNINASFYDIREHFKGSYLSGKMNNHNNNQKYNQLISNLREKINDIGGKN